MTDIMESTFAEQPATTVDTASAARDIHVTARESEVIAHVCNGLSNSEIAREMNVAVQTVKAHMRNIMAKMRVRSRLQLATLMYRERQLHLA
jgi:DNA-binding NarL/FixJ family response regulator